MKVDERAEQLAAGSTGPAGRDTVLTALGSRLAAGAQCMSPGVHAAKRAAPPEDQMGGHTRGLDTGSSSTEERMAATPRARRK